MEDQFQPLEDWEYDELDSFLLGLEHDDAILSLSEFDGFITAVVSGPELILPSEWLQVVWGGADNAPVLESPEAFNRICSLMFRHLNSTVATLMEAPSDFEPCFMESEARGKNYLVVDDWCIGYMKGVMMRLDLWYAEEQTMVELLAPIPLFTNHDGWQLMDQLADRHIEYLQGEIAPAARAAHAYWLERRQEFTAPEGYSVH